MSRCTAGHTVMASIISRISQQHQRREIARHASVMSNITGFLGSNTARETSSERTMPLDMVSTLQTPSHLDTISFSGPGMFTQAISHALHEQAQTAVAAADGSTSGHPRQEGCCQPPLLVVLPVHVFYPIPNNVRDLRSPGRYEEMRQEYVRPGTIAVHQWACSWQR